MRDGVGLTSPLRVNFPKTFNSESGRPEGCLLKLCPQDIGARHAALAHKFSENMGHPRTNSEMAFRLAL
jgi:hypothetical protein